MADHAAPQVVDGFINTLIDEMSRAMGIVAPEVSAATVTIRATAAVPLRLNDGDAHRLEFSDVETREPVSARHLSRLPDILAQACPLPQWDQMWEEFVMELRLADGMEHVECVPHLIEPAVINLRFRLEAIVCDFDQDEMDWSPFSRISGPLDLSREEYLETLEERPLTVPVGTFFRRRDVYSDDALADDGASLYAALRRAGIVTVADLVATTEADLDARVGVHVTDDDLDHLKGAVHLAGLSFAA